MQEKEKAAFIAARFGEIMQALGLNLKDPSLAKTPERVAKMYLYNAFEGMNAAELPKVSLFECECKKQGMVFVKVAFTSFCEHHFVPFIGTAFVAYFPQNLLLGLSDIPKIVHHFAKRPQLQERLTLQIGDAFEQLLQIKDVAVSLDADHTCAIVRGIDKESCKMVTHSFRGKFNDDHGCRMEFFHAIDRIRH